jgi:hypothetical protein
MRLPSGRYAELFRGQAAGFREDASGPEREVAVVQGAEPPGREQEVAG